MNGVKLPHRGRESPQPPITTLGGETIRGAIHLPPLRERREDIPRLATHFLTRCRQELDIAVHSIAPETLELLARHTWPGNIRELQATIREALLRSSGSVLLPEFLPPALLAGHNGHVAVDQKPSVENWQSLGEQLETWFATGPMDLSRRALEHFDRLVLIRAMRQSGGNQSRASEIRGSVGSPCEASCVRRIFQSAKSFCNRRPE